MTPDRYPAALREYAVGPITVGQELGRIAELDGERHPEAIVFHCSRLFEMLSRKAASRFGEPSDCDVYTAIVRLGDLGWLRDSDRSSCHALRRLGNDARHVTRRLSPRDASIASALLDRFLVWFFADFSLGPRLWPSPSAGGRSTDAGEEHELLSRIVRLADAPASVPDDLIQAFSQAWSRGAIASPTTPALLAEILLESGRSAEARDVLSTALGAFPTDLRLGQLQAWAIRAGGDLDGAASKLEAILEIAPSDGETLGLLAGTYKRIAADPRRGEAERREALGRASASYQRAWDLSAHTNTYAGINAATLALRRGERTTSARIAKRILKSYEGRRAALGKGRAIRFAGYWDRATYAEALLLAGSPAEARAAYRTAFALYAKRAEMVRSTKQQLEAILVALDVPGGADAWMAGSTTAETEDMTTKDRPYEPAPLDTSSVELDEHLIELVELLAENNHALWAKQRIGEGWRLGERRDETAKTHPCLVPYADLPESEKKIDREMARETLRTVTLLGWRIER